MTEFQFYSYVFVSIILIYDLFRLSYNKKKIQEYRFRILSKYSGATISMAAFGLILSVSFFIINRVNKWGEHDWVFAILICTNAFLHALHKNYITERGLWFMGYLYPWKHLLDFTIDKDSDAVRFKVRNSFFRNINEYRFEICDTEKAAIQDFLLAKIEQ